MSKASVFGAIESSAKASPKVFPGGISFPKLRGQLVQVGRLAPAWWSQSRDRALREFWKDDGAFLSSLMFNAAEKLVNIPFRIVARDMSIASHVAQAEELEQMYQIASEYGNGVQAAMHKWVEDWLGTDNGGFLEILGEGEKDQPLTGMAWGIRHIDSLTATRTGDPIRPVNVIERGTGRYDLHWTRVMFASQMPSSDSDMLGVGYSSVSRSLMIANDLSSMLNYKAEKMGSRPKSKLLVGQNIGGEEIMQAFAVADAIMNELGLRNFAKLVAIGGIDVKIDSVDLNSFDPFDERTQTTLGLYALAAAWGLEANEILPVTGDKSSDEVAMQRARGKLPQTYVTTVEKQLGFKLLPPHLKLLLDFPDDARDREQAMIEDIHARNTQRMVASGATTERVERRRMYQRGSISRQMFVEMQLEEGYLEDGTPVGSLFFNEGYSHLLLLPREYLVVEEESRADAMRAIQANRAAVLAAMNVNSAAQKRKANEAMAALDWLESLYNKPVIVQADPEPVAPIGIERTPLEDGGKSDKSASFFTKGRLTTSSQTP
jgi:hypothetical protein